MEIKVTQEHINNGKPNSSKNCPIGLALKEALPKEARYNVGWDIIEVTHPNGEYTFAKVDAVLAKFMYDFADGKKVVPFEHGLVFVA